MTFENYKEDEYYGREAYNFEREERIDPFSEDLNTADDQEMDRQAAIQKKYIRESSGRKKRRKKRKKKNEKNQYLLIAGILAVVAILFCLIMFVIIENEDIDIFSPSDIDMTYIEPNSDTSPVQVSTCYYST